MWSHRRKVIHRHGTPEMTRSEELLETVTRPVFSLYVLLVVLARAPASIHLFYLSSPYFSMNQIWISECRNVAFTGVPKSTAKSSCLHFTDALFPFPGRFCLLPSYMWRCPQHFRRQVQHESQMELFLRDPLQGSTVAQGRLGNGSFIVMTGLARDIAVTCSNSEYCRR